MIAALLLLTLQSAPSVTCEPGQVRVIAADGLLGEIPVDRRTSQGPAIYRPHRLTRDGPLSDESATDCVEIAPTLRTGARSEPVVSLSVDLFGNGEAAIVEIATSLAEEGNGESGGTDECAMDVTIRSSDRVALGAAKLPVTYCADVGLWSADVWRLAGGGALAALEFGATRTRNAAGDLHIVYLGRDGAVWKLANLPEVSGHWSTPTGATTSEAGARLFRKGSSMILAVERRVTATSGEPATRSTDWFELSTGRDGLPRLSGARARECLPAGIR